MPGIRLNGGRLSLKNDTLESDSSPLPIILCYLPSPKRSCFYKHCLSIVTKKKPEEHSVMLTLLTI